MGLFTISKSMDIINQGASIIDAAFLTDQEQAEIGIRYAEIYLKTLQNTAGESSARAITRRFLAWGIIIVFLFLLLLAASVWPWYPEYSVFILSVAGVLSTLASGVGIFYFGYYGASQAFGAIGNVIKGVKKNGVG